MWLSLIHILPEARLPLADAVILVATSPKSNSAYDAINAAIADVQAGRTGPKMCIRDRCGRLPVLWQRCTRRMTRIATRTFWKDGSAGSNAKDVYKRQVEVLSIENRSVQYAMLACGYVDGIAANETGILQYMKDNAVDFRILEEPLLVTCLLYTSEERNFV